MKKRLIPIFCTCLLLGGCGTAQTNEIPVTNRETATASATAEDESVTDETKDASAAIAYLEEIPAKDVRAIIDEYEKQSGEDIFEILSTGTEADMSAMRFRFAEYVATEYAGEIEKTSAS